MLARGVSRRREVQIANFGYKNPTAHVLLDRVSQSLVSTQGSGDENGVLFDMEFIPLCPVKIERQCIYHFPGMWYVVYQADMIKHARIYTLKKEHR